MDSRFPVRFPVKLLTSKNVKNKKAPAKTEADITILLKISKLGTMFWHTNNYKILPSSILVEIVPHLSGLWLLLSTR